MAVMAYGWEGNWKVTTAYCLVYDYTVFGKKRDQLFSNIFYNTRPILMEYGKYFPG